MDKSHHFSSFLKLLLILYGTITLIVISHTYLPPQWDQAYYLEWSEIFYQAITNLNFPQLFYSFTHSMYGERPPLVPLITAITYLFAGNTIMTALSINLFATFIIYYTLKSLIKHLFPNNNYLHLLTLYIYLTFPITVYLTKEYLLEYFLTAISLAAVTSLIYTNQFQNTKYSIYTGILVGLGMLTKLTFPVYFFTPFFIEIISAFLKKKEGYAKHQLINFFTFISLAISISLPWYLTNLKDLFQTIFYYGYGQESQYFTMPINAYISDIIKFGISAYYFVALVVCITFTIKTKKLSWSFYKVSQYFFVPFIIFLFANNKDIRFLAPLLIYLSLILAVSIMNLQELTKKIKLSDYLKYLFVLISFISIIIPLLFRELTIPFFPKYDYKLSSSENSDWYNPKIIEYAYNPESEIVSLFYAVDHSYLNAHYGRYLSRKNQHQYEIVTAPSNSETVQWENLIKLILNFDNVLIKTSLDQEPWHTNIWNNQIKLWLETSNSPYQRSVCFPLPDTTQACVYTKKEGAIKNLL